MKEIVLASSNAGKLKEFFEILLPLGLSVKPQSAFNVVDVPETGLTFVENAIIKARHAAAMTGLPALADDSGIEVKALDGRPGIYSARYAGEAANAADRNQKLLNELKALPDAERTARFVCVLVLMRHANDPTPIIAQGFLEGLIADQASGEAGFGYDPLMFISEKNCTVAQLSSLEKNKISHRAQAIQQLLQQLKTDTL